MKLGFLKTTLGKIHVDINLLGEQLGKSRCPLLQESHCTPVMYPRHKQNPLLSFINDFEPKGLQPEIHILFQGVT